MLPGVVCLEIFEEKHLEFHLQVKKSTLETALNFPKAHSLSEQHQEENAALLSVLDLLKFACHYIHFAFTLTGQAPRRPKVFLEENNE